MSWVFIAIILPTSTFHHLVADCSSFLCSNVKCRFLVFDLSLEVMIRFLIWLQIRVPLLFLLFSDGSYFAVWHFFHEIPTVLVFLSFLRVKICPLFLRTFLDFYARTQQSLCLVLSFHVTWGQKRLLLAVLFCYIRISLSLINQSKLSLTGEALLFSARDFNRLDREVYWIFWPIWVLATGCT